MNIEVIKNYPARLTKRPEIEFIDGTCNIEVGANGIIFIDAIYCIQGGGYFEVLFNKTGDSFIFSKDMLVPDNGHYFVHGEIVNKVKIQNTQPHPVGVSLSLMPQGELESFQQGLYVLVCCSGI